MSDELKPVACPFCGHDNVDVFYEGSSDWYVMCGMCVAGGPSERSKIRAIAAWNTRRPAPEQSRETRDVALDVIAQLLLVVGRHDVDTARAAAEEILAAAMDRSALGREGSDADQA